MKEHDHELRLDALFGARDKARRERDIRAANNFCAMIKESIKLEGLHLGMEEYLDELNGICERHPEASSTACGKEILLSKLRSLASTDYPLCPEARLLLQMAVETQSGKPIDMSRVRKIPKGPWWGGPGTVEFGSETLDIVRRHPEAMAIPAGKALIRGLRELNDDANT